MKQILIFLLCYSATTNCNSQVIKTELLNFSKWMDSTNRYSIDVKVSIYSNQNDTIAYKVLNGIIVKNEGSIYTSLYGNETLTEGNRTIFISNTNKLLIYKKDSGKGSLQKKQSKTSYELLQQVDSLLGIADTIIYNGFNSGINVYAIMNKSGLINAMYVGFNDVNQLVYTRYYYNTDIMSDNNKVEIEYNYNIGFAFNNKSIKDFISEANGVITPVGKYKGYQIKIQ